VKADHNGTGEFASNADRNPLWDARNDIEITVELANSWIHKTKNDLIERDCLWAENQMQYVFVNGGRLRKSKYFSYSARNS
jgi:hypothetical protein